MPIDWRTVGPILGGAGASILGGYLQNRSANRQSDFEREQYEREIQRRNAMQGMIAPTLLHAVGYRNPQQIGQMSRQISGEAPLGMASSAGSPAMVPPTQGSTAGKILGGIGAGAGLASLAGLGGKMAGMGGTLGAIGGALGPIGAVAGGLALGASQIGKGRRTANVGVEAFENPFGQKMAAISAGQGGLPELQQAFAEYMQGVNAFKAMGGKHKLVAEQSLNNQALHDTYRRLLSQLGG